MGQPKTPGTMLQDGHNGTNVKVVLAAGTYPWTILHVPDWSGKGCFHWTSPEAQAPGSDATSRAFPYTVESEDFGEKESYNAGRFMLTPSGFAFLPRTTVTNCDRAAVTSVPCKEFKRQ